MIAKIVGLKSANPELKVLLAVGGWTHGTSTFSSMVASKATRKIFIDDVISVLRRRGVCSKHSVGLMILVNSLVK